ncbi:MAG: DNA-deoxyinosine glycosylase [Thermovirgaceae bacterium]|nr:DNA-deoxyinosine glycosylase [Thermovirgaceae bacterium]
MTNCTGFAPVAGKNTRLLILGSFPGIRSLEAGEYYAHPQNSFWRIMGLICDAGIDIPYEERLVRLHSRGIALWDVLFRCERAGSMDGAIIESGSLPNLFPAFFEDHPGISRIFFNGQKAAHLYKRLVTPSIPPGFSSIPRQTLPSTSPAYATMPFEEKALRWRQEIVCSIDRTAPG